MVYEEMKKDINKFEVGDTEKCGKGMFATEDIAKGEKIYFFDGKIFTLDGINKRVSDGDECIDDPLQIDDDAFLDLDEISRMFNHSCDPNAGFRGRSELFAIKDIEKGEEIVYDYSSVVGVNVTSDMWTMQCHCGSDKCRKVIGNILSLPKETLQKYVDAGAPQDYLKRQLKIKR